MGESHQPEIKMSAKTARSIAKEMTKTYDEKGLRSSHDDKTRAQDDDVTLC